MFRSPIFYAFATFVISSIFVGFVLPELTCMDGWESPSIGKSGACSHHGGVNYIPVYIGVFLGAILAFFVWKKTKLHENRLKNPENKVILKVENTSSSIIHLINKLCCYIWNGIVKFLVYIHVPKIFDKHPIITVIVGFFAVAIFPPVMAILFVLGIVAFCNGACLESKFLVIKE